MHYLIFAITIEFFTNTHGMGTTKKNEYFQNCNANIIRQFYKIRIFSPATPFAAFVPFHFT